MDRDTLLRALVGYLADGTLQPNQCLPALSKLAGDEPSSPLPEEVIKALRSLDDAEALNLASSLSKSRNRDALRIHWHRSTGNPVPDDVRRRLGDLPLDAPLEWTTFEGILPVVRRALNHLRDRCTLAPRRQEAPVIFDKVEAGLYESAVDACRDSSAWSSAFLLGLVERLRGKADGGLAATLDTLEERIRKRRDADLGAARKRLAKGGSASFPGRLDEDAALEALRERLAEATTPGEKRRLVDIACTWPTRRIIPLLAELEGEPELLERAGLILMTRFGHPSLELWSDWKQWLEARAGAADETWAQRDSFADQWPGELLTVWVAGQDRPSKKVLEKFLEWCEANTLPSAPDNLTERWAALIPANEWRLISGEPEITIIEEEKPAPAEPPPLPEPEPKAKPRAKPRKKPKQETPPPLPPPPKPKRPATQPLWDAHLKPFIVENWYMVAGVVMFLVGASILAYYTWDKHWLVRYSLVPALLGFFTAMLGWVGGWIERRDKMFAGTAAILRSAAIGLLPVNFMTVALMAADPQVAHKALAVPAMGALYVGLFGWGLHRWCRAVHPSFGGLLGGTLLLLNGLVIIAPVAVAQGMEIESGLLTAVGTGFYLGFLVLALAVTRFSRGILTRELVDEKRIPWFFGINLAVTFLQVFAWVHGYVHHLPQVHTYAPLLILSGGLVLYVERRTLELREERDRYVAESFLGYALILLGTLMGIGSPEMRIVSFALAGIAWLSQERSRREPLHAWIGLTLVLLAGASVALLEPFPPGAIPAVGLGLALLMGAIAWRSKGTLSRAASGMQMAVLALTAATAMIAQWEFRTDQTLTAAYLAVTAGGFAFRGWRDQSIRSIQTAMTLLALVLPYAGCVDMEARTLRGHQIVLGISILSLLWIALTARTRSDLLKNTRSTVLWIYGTLGLAGMLVRVLYAAPTGGAPWGDAIGLVLLTFTLSYAGYTSRSLIPGLFAVFVAAVLGPGLLHEPGSAIPAGVGSAGAAVALVLVAFALRRRPGLADLGEGDRYMGREPFPFTRHDASLFTIPLLAAAIFLAVKVDTWLFFGNLDRGGITLLPAIGLMLSGIAWTLVAVYLRAHAKAVKFSWAGLAWIAIGFAFLSYNTLGLDTAWTALATGLLLQALFFFYRFGLQRRFAWVGDLLVAPVRSTLQRGSIIATLAYLGVIFFGREIGPAILFVVFVVLQLAWHTLATRQRRYGALLFILAWMTLLDVFLPGDGWLIFRFKLHGALAATLWLVLGVQFLLLPLEFLRNARQRLDPLARCFLWGAVALATGMGLVAISEHLYPLGATLLQHLLVLAAVILSARALGAGVLGLLACVLSYMALHHDPLQALTNPEVRIALLAEPWRLGALAAGLALLGHVGTLVARKRPALLAGPFALGPLGQGGALWLQAPALLFAGLAAIIQTVNPTLREAGSQLAGSYIAAFAASVVAFSRKKSALSYTAATLLALGNIHAVRVLLGETLRGEALSEIHLICLGLALTLLQGTLLRLALRREDVERRVNESSLGLAGLILGLLSINYFTSPDLAKISWVRFALSGVMALLAGLYFRHAARHPLPGQERFRSACEGFHHFGVTLALWCAALMAPALRHPATVLVALGVPALYFYLRAEIGMTRGSESGPRYRTSAATLGFLLLALYTFRPIFQMVMFPDSPFESGYYHRNSPVVFVLGLILLRLHGLGGTSWLAFYGGLAVMASTFLAITALPKVSPFEHPAPAAWIALAMTHFWTVASTHRSPIKSVIQRIARIDGPGWYVTRRPWGVCLLVASHGAVLWAVLNALDTRMIAPLILGAATVLIHHGILRRSRIYHRLAALEIAMALHAGVVVPSYLPAESIIWAILSIWTALVVAHVVLRRWYPFPNFGVYVTLLATVTATHILYHHPSSEAGLWGAGLGTLLAAMTPRPSRSGATALERILAAALLVMPTWLVFFGVAPLLEKGPAGAIEPLPLLAMAASLFLTGVFAAVHQRSLARVVSTWTRPRPRLFDVTLSWLGRSGNTLHAVTMTTSFILVAIVQGISMARQAGVETLLLLEGLHLAFLVAWIMEGRHRRTPLPYVAAQLAGMGLYLAIRQHLVQETSFWRPEYDVWVMVSVSTLLAGMKSLIDRGPVACRMPLLVLRFLLPVMAVGWILLQDLGSTAVLIVLALESMGFAYMGRDNRESPYHVVAISGFVSFMLVLFASKLELRELHAYIIPVGMGILVLLQLFGRRVEARTRSTIRLITLLAMLGSAAWYALSDPKFELVHNLTLVGLGLAAMTLGSLMRIRLYLILGFSGLLLDLLSLFYRVISGMERSMRMSTVGVVVLLVGLALVFGAVYYKTHRREVDGWISGWRGRLAQWE